MNEKHSEQSNSKELTLNRLRRRPEVLCDNIKANRAKLLDLIIDENFISSFPDFNVNEFVDIIKNKFDGSLVNFNLNNNQVVEDALNALNNREAQQILVLRYPSFESPLNENDNKILDLYYKVQSLYFHNKNSFPQSVIVQVFDRSLEKALAETKSTDTLLKVSATPQVVFSSE